MNIGDLKEAQSSDCGKSKYNTGYMQMPMK